MSIHRQLWARRGFFIPAIVVVALAAGVITSVVSTTRAPTLNGVLASCTGYGGCAPTFTSAYSATFTAGQPGSFTVTTTGTTPITLSESGALPSGVSFDDLGNGSATLSGTPAAVSSSTNYAFTITATNTPGSTVQDFTLVVVPSGDPTNVTATIGTTTATVSWTAPSGVTVSNYTVTTTCTSNASTCGTVPSAITTNSTSQSVAGLNAGATFTFTVTANLAPSGSGSGTSNTVEAVAAATSSTDTGTTSDSSNGTSTAVVGTAGSSGYVTATGTGEGSVTVGTYASSDPIGAAISVPSGTTAYDVALAPGSAMSSVTFEVCGSSNGLVQWYDPVTDAQTNISPSSAVTSLGGGCLQVTITGSTTPDLNQLVGSVFFLEPIVTSSGGGTITIGSGGGLVLQPAPTTPVATPTTPTTTPTLPISTPTPTSTPPPTSPTPPITTTPPPGAPIHRVLPKVAVVTIKTNEFVLAHKLINVQLACANVKCSGQMSLSALIAVRTKVGTKYITRLVPETLATGNYSLAKTKSGVFPLKVTPVGASLLAHVSIGHAVRVTLTVGVQHGGKTLTKSIGVI